MTRAQGPALYIGETLEMSYLPVFDGLHVYDNVYVSDEKLSAAYSQIVEQAHPAGKRLVATVIGGGGRIQKLGFDIDRSEGRFIRNRLGIAEQAGADWIMITTWNEWFEGRQIEPNREYGFEGIKYAREMTARFKRVGLAPLEGAALSVAYRQTTAGVEVAVSNTGRQNVYYVTCNVGGAAVERVAYVLHPGETAVLSVKSDKPTPCAEVVGYLADDTKVQASTH